MSDDVGVCWRCGTPVTPDQTAVTVKTAIAGGGRPLLLHEECVDRTGPVPVPCPPCLRARLAGRGSDVPHGCEMTTRLALEGNQLVTRREAGCGCPCIPDVSDALKGAGAPAHRTEAPATNERCWECDKPITPSQATVSAVLTVSKSGRGRPLLLHATCVEQPQILLVPCPPCLTALVTGTDAEPHSCEEQPLLAIDGNVIAIPRETGCRGNHPRLKESESLAAARAMARALVAEERARRTAPPGESS